jgi:hypothetical protein
MEESLMMNSPAPHVTLLKPVAPDDAGEPPAIFTRVQQALELLPGPWKVGLAHGVELGWWIISLYREDGFECTLFLDGPLQQTSTYIRDRLADALQRHSLGLAGGASPKDKPKP